MSKRLSNLLFCCLATLLFFTVGCEDDGGTFFDPCEGVICGENQVCSDGTCFDIQSNLEIKSGLLSSNETWTADKYYVLASKVVVPDGVTLTIEPGTIIKGKEGSGSLATALIVARGGTLMAEGTAENPIIFTSELDNIEIGEKSGTNLTASDNSKWGGLIVLGRAKISAEDGDTEAQIEGIPANEEYGRYGGSNDADNSGIIRYVSIRHGGAEIGAGNEINGLTLGGVGNGTQIDHVEVVGNLDDGIECFGGSVDISHAAVIYQGDDAIDVDQNYSGTIDNFVVVMGGGDGDEGLEIDGPENSTYTEGKFTLSNGTIISEDGTHSGSDFKSKAQGTVQGVSFLGFALGKTMKIRENFDEDNDCADKTDALDYALDGTLEFSGVQIDVSGASVTDIATAYTGVDACAANLTATIENSLDHVISNGNDNTVVTSTTVTVGADMTEFNKWSWGAVNGKL